MCRVVQYAYPPENMMLLENYASKRTMFPNLLMLKPFNQNKWKKNSHKYFGILSQDFPKHLISRQLTAILFPRATVPLHSVTCCAYWLLPAVEYPMTFRCGATSRTPSTLSIGSNTRWRRLLQLTSMPVLRHTSPGTEGRVYRCGVRTTPRAFERCDWVNLQKSWDLWV